MNRSLGADRFLSLCLALVIMGCRSIAVAQVPQLTQPADWHFQYDLFQMVLEQSGLQVTKDVNAALDDPANSVIVSIGNELVANLPQDRLYQFAQRGGGLLQASELISISAPYWTLHGGPITSNEPEVQYQGYADCLRVQALGGNSPLTAGVTQLILNRSGWIDRLSGRDGRWEIAARLPRSTTGRSAGKPVVASFQFDGKPASRIVLSADHSLFTNGMLWHGDNAIFAINVANFLIASQRSRLVFLVDGVSRGSYREELAKHHAVTPPDIPPEPLPELELEQLLQVANAVIAKAEDSNLFNEVLANRPRGIAAPFYHRGLLLALAAAMAGWALYLLSRRTVRAPPPLERRSIGSFPAIPSPEQMSSQELARRRGIAIQQLAAQAVADWQGANASGTPAAAASGAVAATMPPITARQSQAFETLREIAQGSPQPISRRRLLELQRMLELINTI